MSGITVEKSECSTMGANITANPKGTSKFDVEGSNPA